MAAEVRGAIVLKRFLLKVESLSCYCSFCSLCCQIGLEVEVTLYSTRVVRAIIWTAVRSAWVRRVFLLGLKWGARMFVASCLGLLPRRTSFLSFHLFNDWKIHNPLSIQFSVSVCLWPPVELFGLLRPSLYSVFPSMLVSALRYSISCLLHVDSPVFLFVGPTWTALDHSGPWFRGLRLSFP
jgi:hypothetical protein